MTDEIVVRFDSIQMEVAKEVARERRRQNLHVGTDPAYGAPQDARSAAFLDLWGAKGELAVATHYHLPWTPVGRWGIRDVAHLEVRTSTYRWCDLRLHKRDKDDTPYICAWTPKDVDATEVRLFGWLLARDGKHERFWRDPTGKGRPAYFVPRRLLHPMSTLPLTTDA